jgi:hypothetical protein
LLADETRWRRVTAAPHQAEFKTNFERKYRLAGKPVFGASFEKLVPAADP